MNSRLHDPRARREDLKTFVLGILFLNGLVFGGYGLSLYDIDTAYMIGVMVNAYLVMSLMLYVTEGFGNHD